jgi:hypothetical protein
VASRCPQRFPFMASISRLDLALGRCSRDRYSALGLRLGNLAGADCTVNFSLSGATAVRCAVAAIFTSSGWPTVHLKRPVGTDDKARNVNEYRAESAVVASARTKQHRRARCSASVSPLRLSINAGAKSYLRKPKHESCTFRSKHLVRCHEFYPEPDACVGDFIRG